MTRQTDRIQTDGAKVAPEAFRPGWLNAWDLAHALGLKREDPRFDMAWKQAALGRMGLPEIEGGPSLRLMRRPRVRARHHIHPEAVPAFAAAAGLSLAARAPAAGEGHLTMAQVATRLSGSIPRGVVAQVWGGLADALRRDGGVRDGDRAVAFSLRHFPGGKVLPCLEEGEVAWFTRAAEAAKPVAKTAEWVSLADATHLLQGRASASALTKAWRELWQGWEGGGTATGMGRDWRVALLRSGSADVFCVHEGEIPQLEAFFRPVAGRAVRMGSTDPGGTERCLDRDGLPGIGKAGRVPLATGRAKDHVSLQDLLLMPLALSHQDACREGFGRLVSQARLGQSTALPDGTPVRLDLTSGPKGRGIYCLRRDDLRAFLLAVTAPPAPSPGAPAP